MKLLLSINQFKRLVSCTLCAMAFPFFSFCQLQKEFTTTPKGNLKDLLRIYYCCWMATLKASDLSLVDDIVSLAKKNGNDELKCYAEMVKDEALFILLKDSARIKPLIEQLIVKYEACAYPQVAALFYGLLARRYTFGGCEKALFYAIKSNALIEKAGWGDVPLSGRLASHFFSIYLNFEDEKTALFFAKNAVTYTDSLINAGNGESKTGATLFDLNNLGVLYLKNNDYVNATSIFLRTYQQAISEHYLIYAGIAIGNYGNTLRLQGRYKEAIPYLYKELLYNQNNPLIDENTAISFIYLADCMTHTDSLAKAAVFFKLSQQRLHGPPLPSYLLKWYQAHIDYCKKQGDYRSVSLYQDSLVNVKDSLKRIFNNKALLQAQIQNEADKYEQEKNILQQNERFVRNGIIAALVVVFGIAFFWLRQTNKEGIKKEKEQQKQTAGELAEANQQLAAYVTQLMEKQQLLDLVNRQVEAATITQEAPKPEQQFHLESLQKSVILTEPDWERFKELFAKAHPGYIEELAREYPGLSPAETRLMVLSQLHISSKEMASMLGISLASLRTAKYRLRKKFPTLLEGEA